ncbi:MAG: hypothetical protein EOL89_00195 [Actinobacteria bacterium]|nr:hypothetical protein [Actinomycetota bacterium]
MSFRPFVFIGLGGSGGKTLRVIRHQLLEMLDAAGWTGPFPAGWQFLHIDVPAKADGIDSNLPYTLPDSDYFPLSNASSTYVNADGAVGRTGAGSLDHYLAWDSWRPYLPHEVKINVRNGAGQYRAVGRVMMLASLRAVSDRIAQAVAAASAPEVAGQLFAVQERLGAKNPSLTASRPEVYVISSVAGGSGSGGILDVCDILRSHGITDMTALLFTPEVFEGANGALQPGIAPNTFMALNELANSMWISSPKDAPDARDVLFRRAGVVPAVDYAGPETVFLVGRRNASITLGNTDEIYKVMGQALAEVATNEALESDLTAYMKGNARQNVAGMPDSLPLSVDGFRDLAQFRALGFARLTIGRDIFRTYATHRLERLVILRLLDRHLERRQPGDPSSDEDLLRESADEVWGTFLDASGLDEVGEDANDITSMLDAGDELRPEILAWQEELLASIRNQARRRIPVGEVCLTVAQSTRDQLAHTALRGRSADLAAQRARVWQSEIQDRLALLVRATMAEYGLPVTIVLMERLVDEVKRSIADVASEWTRRRVEAERNLATLPNPDPALPRTLREGDVDKISEIIKRARVTIRRTLIVDNFEIASRLIEDLHKNLLVPWLHELRNAESLLRDEARPKGKTSVLDIWPRDEGVPQYLRPSPVEFLLDDIEHFPQDFEDVVVRSVENAGGAHNAISRAVSEIIMGPDEVTVNAPDPVITYLSRWSPKASEARPPEQQPARAKLLIRVKMTHLHDRVRAWASDSEKYIGRYLRQSLADYLLDDTVLASVRKDRSSRLVAQFAATLRASSPLVALNPTMIQKVHGLPSPAYEFKMAPLNIPAGDNQLEQQLNGVAAQIVGPGSTIQHATEPSQHVQVMTLLDSAHHMLEIDSVMRPMVSQWGAQTQNAGFWEWRRTRPLTDWVPLGPNARRALVAGWFVGRLLGLTRVVENGGEPALQLLSDGSWGSIGAGAIRPVSSAAAVGNLLEALPVAMLDAYQNTDLAPLEPFGEVIRLGAGLDGKKNAVTRWVWEGSGFGDEDEAILTLLPSDKERLAALLEACDDLEQTFREDVLPEHLDQVREAQKNPSLELTKDILGALDGIRAAARQRQRNGVR